jgi:hypothetical protein
MRIALEIVDVNNTELDDVVRRAQEALDEKDATLIRRVFESYLYVTDLIEDKDTSIRHLRQLFFGKRTEKTKAVVERHAEKPDAAPPDGTAAEAANESDKHQAHEPDKESANEPTSNAADTPACSGHGRNGADAYGGAERINVSHSSLNAGDPCPSCRRGTVYEKAPGVLVRIIGQPPVSATIYQLQKLRCNLCGQVC